MMQHGEFKSVSGLELKLLDAYLRDQLAPAQRDDFELHLLQHSELAALAEQEQLVAAALAKLANQSISVEIPDIGITDIQTPKTRKVATWQSWPAAAAVALGLGMLIGSLAPRSAVDASAAQLVYLDQLRSPAVGARIENSVPVNAEQVTVLMVPLADPACLAEVEVQQLGKRLRLPLKADSFGYAAVVLPKHWLRSGAIDTEVFCGGNRVASYRAYTVLSKG